MPQFTISNFVECRRGLILTIIILINSLSPFQPQSIYEKIEIQHITSASSSWPNEFSSYSRPPYSLTSLDCLRLPHFIIPQTSLFLKEISPCCRQRMFILEIPDYCFWRNIKIHIMLKLCKVLTRNFQYTNSNKYGWKWSMGWGERRHISRRVKQCESVWGILEMTKFHRTIKPFQNFFLLRKSWEKWRIPSIQNRWWNSDTIHAHAMPIQPTKIWKESELADILRQRPPTETRQINQEMESRKEILRFCLYLEWEVATQS